MTNVDGWRLNMQTDGNLVLYDGSGTPLWSSGTQPSGYKVTWDKGTNSDSALVVQDINGTALWTSDHRYADGKVQLVLYNERLFFEVDQPFGYQTWQASLYGPPL